MKVTEAPLAGALVIEPNVFSDKRGFFLEIFNDARFASEGLPTDFRQDNLSFSKKGVLRGLHFQNPHPQGKLVWTLQGLVFDVVVDLRKDSSTFGEWFGIELSCENKKQLYVPPGFGHGFMVMSETALFAYKCTDLYNPASEKCLLWSDPDLGIKWPKGIEVKVSEKDEAARRLKDFSPAELF